MRPRPFLLAMLLAAAALVLPAAASAKRHRHAAPWQNHGLTIAAAPNPISTGDPVLVYGRLSGAGNAGRQITLWHDIAGVPGGFSPVTRTTTDANGFWSIARADGVVTTNRAWFATAGRGVHSRTIRERVHATVTLDQPAGPLSTRQPVTLTGAVAPNHAGQRVLLQRQDGANGDRWRRVDVTRVGPDSRFAFQHRFLRPGDRTLRAVFPGDRRNERGESTPISITVQQEQVEGFTIASSIPSADFGQTVTLSGTLAGAAAAGTSVTLFARGELTPPRRFRAVATASTDAAGAYAFTQSPARNTVYQVRVTTDPGRRTAPLSQGVHSVVSVAASASSASVGDQVTFTGTVQPSKAGHVILLQRLGDDGVWRIVALGRVGAGSTYALGHVLQIAGPAQQFRTLVPGGPANQRGISSAVTIAVNPSAASALPGSGLPPAS